MTLGCHLNYLPKVFEMIFKCHFNHPFALVIMITLTLGLQCLYKLGLDVITPCLTHQTSYITIVICSKSAHLLQTIPIFRWRMEMGWSLNGPIKQLNASRKICFSIARDNHCLWFLQISLQVASEHILGDLWSQVGAYAWNLWKFISNSKMLGKIQNHLC